MEDFELIRNTMKKEDKSEVEHVLLKYYYTLAIISDILVDQSKLHISDQDAIRQIRECMKNNL